MNLRGSILTEHARFQMERRLITERELRRLLDCTEEIIHVRKGGIVVQGMSRNYLLRVFLDLDRDPPELGTCYRTSKISKYRRP